MAESHLIGNQSQKIPINMIGANLGSRWRNESDPKHHFLSIPNPRCSISPWSVPNLDLLELRIPL